MASRPSFPKELVCPAVTADTVAFRITRAEADSYRKDAVHQLQVLLIRRGIPPYEGMWALPGGFLRPNEDIEGCARREIREETGVSPMLLLPVGVFSDLDRDPRGRVISHAYAAVLNEESTASVGGTDASDAQWFSIAMTGSPEDRLLTLQRQGVCLTARLTLADTPWGTKRAVLAQNDGLAFDHALIVAAAYEALQKKARLPQTLLDLLPGYFTLTALQQTQEAITGIPSAAANFRRKMADYVEETDQFTAGSGHRPARLFRRRTETEESV